MVSITTVATNIINTIVVDGSVANGPCCASRMTPGRSTEELVTVSERRSGVTGRR